MKRKLTIIIVIVIVVVAAAVWGTNLLINNSHYVATDNANIGAPLIAVSSLSAGQMTDVAVSIGDHVVEGQKIAEVGTPRYDTGTRQGFQAGPVSTASVEAPLSGYVAAVWTYSGALIGAGTSIVTLYDDSNIWVTANIDENEIHRVHPGQAAEVTVDSLGGQVLKGQVQAIVPATAGSFSLLPSSNTSANFTKVAQVVPVRITLENPEGLALIPGSSVEVRIDTQ